MRNYFKEAAFSTVFNYIATGLFTYCAIKPDETIAKALGWVITGGSPMLETLFQIGMLSGAIALICHIQGRKFAKNISNIQPKKKKGYLGELVSDDDLGRMIGGFYNKREKMFIYQNYKPYVLTLTKDFPEAHKNYNSFKLIRVPLSAKTVKIRFEIPLEKVGQRMLDFERDYKFSFLIKRGNERDKVDPKSNEFILDSNHLRKCHDGYMGSSKQILCFDFCIETKVNSILTSEADHQGKMVINIVSFNF